MLIVQLSSFSDVFFSMIFVYYTVHCWYVRHNVSEVSKTSVTCHTLLLVRRIGFAEYNAKLDIIGRQPSRDVLGAILIICTKHEA